MSVVISELKLVTLLEMRKLGLIMAVSLLFFSIFIAYRFIFHPPLSIMPEGIIEWQFAIPGFISVRLFGAMCGAILSYIVVLFFIDEHSKSTRFYLIMAISLTVGLVIWSATRAAIIGTIGSVCIIVMIYRIRTPLRNFAAIFVATAIGATLATALIPHGDSAFMLYNPGDYNSAANATGGRLELWSAAWNNFKEVPLFGAGPGAMVWTAPDGVFRHIQPHNVFLQFLLHWGAIGGSAGLLLVAYAIISSHRVCYRAQSVLPALAMFDCILIMSLFDGTLHFQRFLMMLSMSLGIIFAGAKLTDEHSGSNAQLLRPL
jgi:exopolysaccharide production protein ExoQ